MGQFRKKPVVVEAVLWTGENEEEMLAFLGDAYFNHGGTLKIHTREGLMEGLPGAWIIKGVKGEFYPCAPEIFVATYEPVGEGPDERVR
jgi:hypothetical protein